MLTALLLYLILGAGIPAADAIPLVIAPPHQISLAGHLENLVDKSGGLTLADILAKPEVDTFEKLPGFVNRGYLAGASWTRFSYTTPTGGPAEWYLRLVPAILDDVRVYVQKGPDPTSPASYQEYQLGDHYPMTDRRIRHLDMITPFPPAVAAPRTVYIRVATSSTHNLQAWLYTSDDLIAWSGNYALLVGLMLGILLVVVMVNAFYAVAARSALFAYYSLFVLCSLLRQLGLDGALFTLWPSGAHLVNDWFVGGGVGLGLSTYSLFAMSLFSTREHRPLTHRYLQANVLIGVLATLSVPLGGYGRLAPFLIVSFLLLSCYAPLLAVEYARRRGPGSGLLVFGFAVAVIPIIPRFLSVLGLIPSTWVTSNAYIFGFLAQAVVMTMALVQQLQISQKQLLEVTRQAKVWATELAEERTMELTVKQRELEQALAEKQQALEHESRFLDMISHEYRTPLAIIGGNLQLIDHYGVAADSPLLGPLAKIRRGARRMLEIFDNTLEHSRLRDTLPHLNLQPLNPKALLEEVAAETHDLFHERTISVIAPEDSATILGDHDLLRTAFINLTANAVKYSPPDTSIELEVRPGTSGMILEVRDQGPGILPADRERIFEKFHRGSASAGTSGFGVGLWLVKRIIEEHDGTIVVADNIPHGAVVRITLPAVHGE